MDSFLVMRYDLAVRSGAFISLIGADSPAALAGLEPGDVIVKIDGVEVLFPGDLITELHEGRIGQQIEITYWRGDRLQNTTVKLAPSPPPES